MDKFLSTLCEQVEGYRFDLLYCQLDEQEAVLDDRLSESDFELKMLQFKVDAKEKQKEKNA